ncbi:LOW QUALITY PROTEIN: centrosomal protein of 164 kDa [Rhinatrema bivittatum]|uniref:LOW QUALITY PROTEIN: centrosomal protein of 164 kDa n=1 Tax=Rhinatrema bivittatum TaxID=194408 RepID=UPI001129508B|nr:LOW QUALITY PROTEIN: centrosomal protein of 164 kDa [Rhinatrema bivittatum]
MAGPPVRIGDQLILEEDYDENYIPSEQEIKEYAREIGLDPDNEPELMWLAREGIVAPLPVEWKPCQDITGDIYYYFNFSTGQSTWDHPNDEHYRDLVLQERRKLQAQGGAKKKEKKKKKRKKERRKKRSALHLGSPLAPVLVPLGALAPLRGLVDTSGSTLRGSFSSSSLGSSGGFDTLLGISGGPSAVVTKPSGYMRSTLGSRQEERVSLTLPGLEEEDEEEDGSEVQSLKGSARLLRNLHLDIGSLGGGFEYEESQSMEEGPAYSRVEKVREAEPQSTMNWKDEAESLPEKESLKEWQLRDIEDASLHSDAICPPTLDKIFSGNADSLSSRLATRDSPRRHAEASPRGTPGDGTDERGGATNAPEVEASNAGALANVTLKKDTPQILSETRLGATDLRQSSSMHWNDESDPSEQVKELQVSDRSEEHISDRDFVFHSNLTEQVLVVDALSSVLYSSQAQLLEGRKDNADGVSDEEPRKRSEVESARGRSPTGSCDIDKGKGLILANVMQEEETSEQDKSVLVTVPHPEESAAPHQVCDKQELEHEASLKQPPRESSSDRIQRKELEKEKSQLHKLQEELRKKEEEDARLLQQQHEQKLRTLKERLKAEMEEEEAQVKKERDRNLAKLRAQISAETEAEERKMRAEKNAAMQDLREEMESLQKSERENLKEKKTLLLGKLQKEMDDALREEKGKIMEEKERAVQELRSGLERQREEALGKLEKQYAKDLEQLRVTAEEKQQRAVASIQEKIMEAQQSEKLQLQEDLLLAQRRSQVIGYERELSDLLKEKRQEVERDHERKLEKLKQDHQHILERSRERYEDEERKQRARLLGNLQEELQRMTQLHEREQAVLRQDMEGRLSDLCGTYQEKERRVHNLEEQLEFRSTEIKAKTAQLSNQEELLSKKRQQLQEEEEDIAKIREEVMAARLDRQELEELRKEHRHLLESIRQSRRALEELQDQKADLESKVEVLQRRSQRLQKRISELEAEMQNKQILKETSMGDRGPSPTAEKDLRVEDLRETSRTQARSQLTPLPKDDQSSWSDVRHYISLEGVSIKNAKEFLIHQTKSMRKRQTALKVARQQWRHDMHKAQEELQDPESSQILEDVRRNLEEEAKHLNEMKAAMWKGQVLLRKKEEKLSELESSLLEELSEEDKPKGAASKKVVTFDLSDSEETSTSVMSTDLPQHPFDLKPELQLSQPNKVQYLSDSLYRITTELNGILGVLGSAIIPSASAAGGIPLSTYTSLARGQLPGQWAWSTGLSPSMASSAAQTVDSMLTEKWHKYFPEGIPSLSGNPPPFTRRLGYLSASEQIRLLQQSQLRVPEPDRQTIQTMIDANKKWLENFKNDPKVPLYTRTTTTSPSPGLLQLGLDENNQIKVYHY